MSKIDEIINRLMNHLQHVVREPGKLRADLREFAEAIRESK